MDSGWQMAVPAASLRHPLPPLQIRPVGEWSAKVEALLRRLIHLATTSPAEKSLVFSQVSHLLPTCHRSHSLRCKPSLTLAALPPPTCLQFPDALKMAGMALQTNGIRFVQLLGGKQAVRGAPCAALLHRTQASLTAAQPCMLVAHWSPLRPCRPARLWHLSARMTM
jgi:hypothetical protein